MTKTTDISVGWAIALIRSLHSRRDLVSYFAIFALVIHGFQMQQKYLSDLAVLSNVGIGEGAFLLKLKAEGIAPTVLPGQFVEVRVDGGNGVFLRRPISIHNYDEETRELELLIRKVGKGTEALSHCKPGDSLSIVLPLGNGFDVSTAGRRPLLVGGGVGVAPLLLLAKELKKRESAPVFLLGSKTKGDLLRLTEYEAAAEVGLATEDGSAGVKGFVTDHKFLSPDGIKEFTAVLQCGPTPMMKAVAAKAQAADIPCFASLENKMACGFGVCLCCVTETVNGNKRVCADGPVFNVKDLKW